MSSELVRTAADLRGRQRIYEDDSGSAREAKGRAASGRQARMTADLQEEEVRSGVDETEAEATR